MSAKFKIVKNRNYTVISNYHFRDTNLSMKAKGLLGFMLSVPDDWDYSERGLAKCFSDGRDAVRSTLKELEEHGYLIRQKVRDEKGRLCGTDYLIFESPEENQRYMEKLGQPQSDLPWSENPTMDEPTLVSPASDNPRLEKTPNIKSNNQELTKEIVTEINNLSVKDIEAEIKTQIDYDYLESEDSKIDREVLANILDVIIELRCMTAVNKSIRIRQEIIPSELVTRKLDKLTSEHIRYVLECFKHHSDKIKNIKSYLQKTILNASDTLDSYYDVEVRSDFKYRRSE